MNRIASFLGSPRNNGNSEVLLNTVLDTLKESGAEILPVFRLCEMKISPCRECGGCDNTGQCIIEDDFQKIYNTLATEKLFIVASPVFFMGNTAWLKSMIDRCQCCWTAKYILKKPVANALPDRKGLFLSVCGMKNPSVFDCAIKEIGAFFAVNNISFTEKLLIPDTDKIGQINSDIGSLERARNIARMFISR